MRLAISPGGNKFIVAYPQETKIFTLDVGVHAAGVLMHLLANAEPKDNNANSWRVNFTYEQLRSASGMSNSSLLLALYHLETAGVLTINDDHFVVNDLGDPDHE